MLTYEYHKCGAVFPSANFWVNTWGCSDEFHVAFDYFEDLKKFILNILKEKLVISCLVCSFYPKTV